MHNTPSIVHAARSRIKDIGGDPNNAAAHVSFELVKDEESYEVTLDDTHDYTGQQIGSVFESLLSAEMDAGNNDCDHDISQTDKWGENTPERSSGSFVGSDIPDKL